MKSINIQSKNIVKTETANRIEIAECKITLNESAEFIIRIYNEELLISTKIIEIKGEEYNNWGSDDNYIETLILSKLEMNKRD